MEEFDIKDISALELLYANTALRRQVKQLTERLKQLQAAVDRAALITEEDAE